MSGWELDLETCQLIRQNFTGPIYCDLHMRVHAVQPDGWRVLQPLPNFDQWCRCFDLLQMNEDEVTTVARDPMELAAIAMTAGVRCLTVTLGCARRRVLRGAGRSIALPISRRRRRSIGGHRTAAHGARSRALRCSIPAIPTGCGDVWGATYFSRLLAGDDIADRDARGAPRRGCAT